MLGIALCFGLPLSGGGAPARAAIDLGADLMRLTNLDRVALGRSALAIDPTLVGLAGSAPYHCPSSSGMLLAGRATDMAQRGYFSHGIEGCANPAGADYTIIDVLASQFGYDTYRAEDIGAWAGDPSAGATYQAGCDASGAGCAGETVTVSAPVAWAEKSFMVSPEHRSIILGSYDRFGCGSAQAGDGRTYFVCLFSLGGPGTTDGAPPIVVSASGSHATYAYGSGRVFTARVHDDQRLASASATLDGTRLASWRYPAVARNSTIGVTIASGRLTRGTHRLVWRVVDAAGNAATRSVLFTVR